MSAKPWEFPYYKYTLGRRKVVVAVAKSGAERVRIGAVLRIGYAAASGTRQTGKNGPSERR